MSFAGKLMNTIQISVLTVVSVIAFVTVSGATVYGGSRVADRALGLEKHTSLKWLGDHAAPLAEGARAIAHIAVAVGFNGAASK